MIPYLAAGLAYYCDAAFSICIVCKPHPTSFLNSKSAVMSLTLDQVQRVADLARIEISDQEALATQNQLNEIFVLIEQMQAIDTQGVEPMAHAQELSQRLRPDVVTETNRREAYQAISPEVEAGLFLVPKVIE
jgi:aspartyl-tRNA(Asn)/glutamyl-tRNA(Gln) amidotransferase subunit C